MQNTQSVILIGMKSHTKNPHQNQRHSQNPLSAVNSQNCQTSNVKLHRLKAIPIYKNLNRPLLSPKRRDAIQQKLMLQKEASRAAAARLKQNQPFVYFDKNPFSIQNKKKEQRQIGSRSFSKLPPKVENNGIPKTSIEEDQNIMEAKNINIVEAVRNIKYKKHQISDQEKLRQIFTKTSKISENLQKLVKQSQQVKPRPQNNSQNICIIEQQITFDEILKMPDSNFYQENQKDINIFNFLKKKMDSFVTKDLLDKNYFCHHSIVDKMNRFKFQTQRQISKRGRQFIRNVQIPKSVRLDFLNSNELSINQHSLNFVDLMGVSSGRFNPQLINDILNDRDAQRDNNSSIFDEQEVINYKDNQVCRGINFDLKGREKLLKTDYLKLENNKTEQRYHIKYQNISKDTINQLQTVRNIYENAVKDKPIHRSYSQKINSNLQYLLNMDTRHFDDQNQKIRYNKVNKNRQERLKIKQLLHSIQIKNKYQQKFRELLRPNRS